MPAILLVEDNEDFRFYLKDNLRLHYKVFEAANGKEGWQKALAHYPQLIVSDISMPSMDGIELTCKIKSDKRTSHIPVILLTALTGEEEQIKGLKTGANDYITKPFNFEVQYLTGTTNWFWNLRSMVRVKPRVRVIMEPLTIGGGAIRCTWL